MPGRGCWPWERSWPEVPLRLKDSDLWWLWSSIPPHNDDCWLGCPGRIVFLHQETLFLHILWPLLHACISSCQQHLSRRSEWGGRDCKADLTSLALLVSDMYRPEKCHPDSWICIPRSYPVAMVSNLSDPGHEVDAGRRLKAGGPFKRSIRSINELGLPSLRNGLNISLPH